MKSSKGFYNEYLKTFRGKKIDPAVYNGLDGIHMFFETNKEKLTSDH